MSSVCPRRPHAEDAADPAESHLPRRRDALGALAALTTAAGLPGLAGCLRQLVYHPQVQGGELLIPAARLAELRGPADVLALRGPEAPGALVLRRRADGTFVALQALCSHRSCELTALPDSYECPCHGSRFDAEGRVLEGPAERPLTQLAVRATAAGCAVLLPPAAGGRG